MVAASADGHPLWQATFLPFGQEYDPQMGTNNYKFTLRLRSGQAGQERDPESGLDYFGARYYASSVGRFTIPDPLMASARASNPQTWNRYTYALNNPLRFVDPLGLFASPAYNCTDGDKNCLNDEQRRILENSTVEIDRQKLSGEELYNALGQLPNGEAIQNAFVNVTDRLASITLDDGSNALSLITSITSFQEDRVIANADPSLATNLLNDARFSQVTALDRDHPGHSDLSFKSNDARANIQFSFSRARTSVDVDHDLRRGIGHLFEVLRNKSTGQRTDQDAVRRLLIARPDVAITPSPDPNFNRPQ